MNKTDEILDRLKGMQPTIDNPEELTDSIMDMLPDVEQQHTATKVRLWSYIVTFAAAAGLLLLFSMGFDNNKAIEQTAPTKEMTAQVRSLQTIAHDTIMEKVKKLQVARVTKHKADDCTVERYRTDSIEYYANKLEQELQQLSNNYYIETVESMIEDDEELSKSVNQFLNTTIDTLMFMAEVKII